MSHHNYWHSLRIEYSRYRHSPVLHPPFQNLLLLLFSFFPCTQRYPLLMEHGIHNVWLTHQVNARSINPRGEMLLLSNNSANTVYLTPLTLSGITWNMCFTWSNEHRACLFSKQIFFIHKNLVNLDSPHQRDHFVVKIYLFLNTEVFYFSQIK